MHLVLLTFGEAAHHHSQALFALLTFLRSPLIENASIYTDVPEFYRLCEQDSRVSVQAVSQAQLSEWKGKAQFFWRVKIKAVEAAIAAQPNQDILYVDSDTFLYQDLEAIKQGLAEGKPYMHTLETTLGAHSLRMIDRIYQSLNGKTFAQYRIGAESEMWNAGVIALPAASAATYVADALMLCDAMTATDCERILLEQFAFSLALNREGNLQKAEHWIGHYCGNKTAWNQATQLFILRGLMQGMDFKQLCAYSGNFDFLALPLIEIPRNRAIQLHRLVDKYFPSKRKTYFQASNKQE